MIAPTGGYFTYAYDQANRLTWMSNPEGDRTTFSYDMADRRTLKKMANGTCASFTYDAADQILQLFNLRSDDSLISGFTYDTDAVGNRTSVLEGTGDRVTWTYDRTNQLTSEHRSGAHTYVHTFVYDPVGNRLLKLEDEAITTYTYDVANQLGTSTDSTAQTQYLFDANGNQQIVAELSGARTTWMWDYENQPQLVVLSNNERVTMGYNGDFRRTHKQDMTFGTMRFIWDQSNDNNLLELSEHGSVAVVYTSEPLRYGSITSQRRSDIRHWLHTDFIGSTRQLTTPTGSTSDTLLYDAWGNVLARSGNATLHFQWLGDLGCHHDKETASYYVRRRSYSAQHSRWLSPDPIGFAAGDANHYRYVDNRPISFSDPLGLCCEPCNITKIRSVVNDRGKPALDTPFGKVGAGVDLNIPGLQLPRGRQGLIGVNKVFWIVLEGENLGDCEVSRYVTGTFKVNGNLTPTPIKKPLEGKFPVTPHEDYIDPQRDRLIVPPGIAPHEIQTGDGVIVIADAPGIVPSRESTRLDVSYHFLIDVKSPCAKKRVASFGFDLILRGNLVEGTFQNPGVHTVSPPWLSWPSRIAPNVR